MDIKSRRLPSWLQEVEWIGTSYEYSFSAVPFINTNITPTGTTTIEGNIRFTHQDTSTNAIFGSLGIQANNSKAVFMVLQARYSGKINAFCDSAPNNNNASFETTNLSEWKYFYLGADKRQIGNVINNRQLSLSSLQFDGCNPASIYIGRAQVGWSADWKGGAENKTVTIKNNGIIIGEFIPCYSTAIGTGYRGTTEVSNVPIGTIGMYDTVTGRFQINANTSSSSGTFTKGADVVTVDEITIGSNSVNVIKNASNVILWQKALNEYERVKYLQSSGHQYIDSGIIFTNSIKIISNFTPISTSGLSFVYGAGDVYYSPRTELFLENGIFKASFFSGLKNIVTNYTLQDYRVEISQSSCIVNGTSISFTGGSGTSPKTLCIFARNGNGVTTGNTGIQIKNFVLNDNGTITNDFAPFIRKSDNKPCMVDMVNRIAYFNQGTGEFGYEKMDGTVVAPT